MQHSTQYAREKWGKKGEKRGNNERETLIRKCSYFHLVNSLKQHSLFNGKKNVLRRNSPFQKRFCSLDFWFETSVDSTRWWRNKEWRRVSAATISCLRVFRFTCGWVSRGNSVSVEWMIRINAPIFLTALPHFLDFSFVVFIFFLKVNVVLSVVAFVVTLVLIPQVTDMFIEAGMFGYDLSKRDRVKVYDSVCWFFFLSIFSIECEVWKMPDLFSLSDCLFPVDRRALGWSVLLCISLWCSCSSRFTSNRISSMLTP